MFEEPPLSWPKASVALFKSSRQNAPTMQLSEHAPALNVVVFRAPGPADDQLDDLSADFTERKTVCPLGGGLGYLVLEPVDFDRIWTGVSDGDAQGTADAVLHFLGPNAQQFISRSEDFVYGWVGADDEPIYERVLLLQIIPRPHMIEMMRRRTEMN